MSYPVTLRLAQASDAAAIRAVAEAAWWKTYLGILSDDAIEEALESHYADDSIAAALAEGQQWVLAEQDGVLLGFCATEFFADRLLIFVHKLYVDPNKQGTGSGKQLMQYVMGLQPSARAVQLLVNRGNHKAQAFYLRQGLRMRQSVTVIASEDFIKEDFLMERLLAGHVEVQTESQAPTTEEIL